MKTIKKILGYVWSYTKAFFEFAAIPAILIVIVTHGNPVIAALIIGAAELIFVGLLFVALMRVITYLIAFAVIAFGKITEWIYS